MALRFSVFHRASQTMERGLVSSTWVADSLKAGNPRLRILDATWFLPNSPFACPVDGSSAAAEFAKGPRLPGAGFFDLDAIADKSSGLPHMLPTGEILGKALASLGVSRDSEVVVYDRLGIFSAPRLWYTLKAFGHPAVAVLDGGLPRWLEEGREVRSGAPDDRPGPAAEVSWTLNTSMVWDLQQVMENVSAPSAQVIDARPGPRFHGSAPEPRAGMRGGHIPSSLSVPFGEMLTPERKMKSQAQLTEVFAAAGVPLQAPSAEGTQPFLVTSCGSGMTAAILGLALRTVDFPVETHWGLYDGSWTEYGSKSDTKIVKTGPAGEEESVPPFEPNL